MAVIYFNGKRNGITTRDSVVFGRMVLMVIAIMTADAAVWFMDGMSFRGVRIWIYGLNIVYYILSCLAAIAWLDYVMVKIVGATKHRIRRHESLLFWCFAVYCFFVATTPITKLVFYVDESNRYARGEYYFTYIAICAILVLCAMGLTISHLKEAVTKLKKEEYLSLILFSMFPLVGFYIQYKVYNAAFMWPCASVSILYAYLNVQSKLVLMDPLTGLNNRRSFDNYIKQQLSTQTKKKVYVVLMDIDDFKNINDSFGHHFGDKALSVVAQVLKDVFIDEDAFVARYGGDEFAVVLSSSEPISIPVIENSIKNAIEINTPDILPFKIRVSTGTADMDETYKRSPKELVDIADKRMYSDKSKNKQKIKKRV